jgi:heptosyltransferase-3
MYNKIKNILVIKLRYLGDVVVTTPVFKELRYHYPKAFIAALVNKGTEAMLTQNPDIDKL